MGKVTKTEKFLLIFTALFLFLLLGVCFAQERGGTGGYTVTVEQEAEWELEERYVNINTAPPETLQRLPGIGEVLARRIVERRETAGPFRSVEELLEIEGIGPGKLEELRPWAVVEDKE